MKFAVRNRSCSFVVGAIVCVALLAPVAQAGVVLDLPASYLTGAHSVTLNDVPSEVYAVASWGQGFSITSTFEYDPDLGMFKYTYEIDANKKDISHFIIEVSPDIEDDELVGMPKGAEDPKLYKPGQNGNSNLWLPADIFGFKVDLSTDTNSYNFSFYSPRLPMFGSFYSKGGNDKGVFVHAYNAGLTSNAQQLADYANMTWDELAALNRFIYVPDTATLPTATAPVPAGALLGGLGMGCLALRKLRRRKN